jgi:hypothetical protein
MQKIICFFILVFLSAFTNAQEKTDSLILRQYKIVEKISLLNDDSLKIKKIDSLLTSGEITYDKYIAGLYSMRADVLYEMFSDEIADYTSYLDGDSIKSDSTFIKQVMDTIVSNYTKAIEACTFCSPMFIVKRMNFYSATLKDSLYQKDLETAKKHNFKQEYTVMGELGINYYKGKYDWLGGEVSAASLFQRGYALKNIDPKTGKRKKVDDYSLPVGADVFTVGYNQNLNIKANEFTLSLVRITAPVFFSVTKFGILQSPTEKHLLWFYRPEIGIGNSFISIGYSYNLVFQKSERNHWEKHLLVIKVTIPTFMVRDFPN